jgi:hypothetical protein
MMSESALSRYAGPIVLIVGAYLTVAHLALEFVFVSFNDVAVMVADPLFRVLNLGYAAAFPGFAIAAFAAYDKQAREAGIFGLVALCAAIIGTVNLGANMWFEGFAVPWLAGVVPQILTAEKTLFWQVGYLSSYILLLFPVPGQHPQPSDVWWWHQGRRQQPVLQQLGDPLRVPYVALAGRAPPSCARR